MTWMALFDASLLPWISPPPPHQEAADATERLADFLQRSTCYDAAALLETFPAHQHALRAILLSRVGEHQQVPSLRCPPSPASPTPK